MTMIDRAPQRHTASVVAVVAHVEGHHVVNGVVVPGDRRGRELGFPTANLLMGADALVEDGVWAGSVWVDGREHLAVVSLGHRPTYYESGDRLLEAHLIDFSGDLYGRPVSVVLTDLLRPQRRFGSTIALVRQMRKDVEEARRRRCMKLPHWTARASGDRRRRADVGSELRAHQRQRRIAAAVQHALERYDLDYERVAADADVPVGFLRWTYPTLTALGEAASTARVAHPF